MSLEVALGIEFEDGELLSEELEAVNVALEANGLPPHEEPGEPGAAKSRTSRKSMSYTTLKALQNTLLSATRDVEAWPEFDPVESMLEALEDRKLHLVCHSESEGYYVPTDFELAIYDESVPGEWVGSSAKLLAELALIAPELGVKLTKGKLSDVGAQRIALQGSEQQAGWLCLYEAARLSLEHRTVIRFG